MEQTLRSLLAHHVVSSDPHPLAAGLLVVTDSDALLRSLPRSCPYELGGALAPVLLPGAPRDPRAAVSHVLSSVFGSHTAQYGCAAAVASFAAESVSVLHHFPAPSLAVLACAGFFSALSNPTSVSAPAAAAVTHTCAALLFAAASAPGKELVVAQQGRLSRLSRLVSFLAEAVQPFPSPPGEPPAPLDAASRAYAALLLKTAGAAAAGETEVAEVAAVLGFGPTVPPVESTRTLLPSQSSSSPNKSSDHVGDPLDFAPAPTPASELALALALPVGRMLAGLLPIQLLPKRKGQSPAVEAAEGDGTLSGSSSTSSEEEASDNASDSSESKSPDFSPLWSHGQGSLFGPLSSPAHPLVPAPVHASASRLRSEAVAAFSALTALELSNSPQSPHQAVCPCVRDGIVAVGAALSRPLSIPRPWDPSQASSPAEAAALASSSSGMKGSAVGKERAVPSEGAARGGAGGSVTVSAWRALGCRDLAAIVSAAAEAAAAAKEKSSGCECSSSCCIQNGVCSTCPHLAPIRQFPWLFPVQGSAASALAVRASQWADAQYEAVAVAAARHRHALAGSSGRNTNSGEGVGEVWLPPPVLVSVSSLNAEDDHTADPIASAALATFPAENSDDTPLPPARAAQLQAPYLSLVPAPSLPWALAAAGALPPRAVEPAPVPLVSRLLARLGGSVAAVRAKVAGGVVQAVAEAARVGTGTAAGIIDEAERPALSWLSSPALVEAAAALAQSDPVVAALAGRAGAAALPPYTPSEAPLRRWWAFAPPQHSFSSVPHSHTEAPAEHVRTALVAEARARWHEAAWLHSAPVFSLQEARCSGAEMAWMGILLSLLAPPLLSAIALLAHPASQPSVTDSPDTPSRARAHVRARARARARVREQARAWERSQALALALQAERALVAAAEANPAAAAAGVLGQVLAHMLPRSAPSHASSAQQGSVVRALEAAAAAQAAAWLPMALAARAPSVGAGRETVVETLVRVAQVVGTAPGRSTVRERKESVVVQGVSLAERYAIRAAPQLLSVPQVGGDSHPSAISAASAASVAIFTAATGESPALLSLLLARRPLPFFGPVSSCWCARSPDCEQVATGDGRVWTPPVCAVLLPLVPALSLVTPANACSLTRFAKALAATASATAAAGAPPSSMAGEGESPAQARVGRLLLLLASATPSLVAREAAAWAAVAGALGEPYGSAIKGRMGRMNGV